MTEKKLYNKKEDNLSDANYEINFNNGFCKKNDTSQMNRFKNKFAVVTGANGDFGKFCAEKLAEEGCSVILWENIVFLFFGALHYAMPNPVIVPKKKISY